MIIILLFADMALVMEKVSLYSMTKKADLDRLFRWYTEESVSRKWARGTLFDYYQELKGRNTIGGVICGRPDEALPSSWLMSSRY
jgi:hypothetical protein